MIDSPFIEQKRLFAIEAFVDWRMSKYIPLFYASDWQRSSTKKVKELTKPVALIPSFMALTDSMTRSISTILSSKILSMIRLWSLLTGITSEIVHFGHFSLENCQ